MADNTVINAGAGGDTIGDDDIGGVKYQRVKLITGVDGTNDGDVANSNPLAVKTTTAFAEDTAHVSADKGDFTLGVANEAGTALSSADGDYTPFATDTRGIADVKIRQPQFWAEANVPGVAAAVYAAGDQFGTLITIANAARFAGGGGFITGVTLFDDDDLQVGDDVYFYNDTPTLAADNAVYAINDADNRKELWCAQIPYFRDNGAQRTGALVGVSIPYFCTGTSLFVAIRTQSAVTPTATGVRYRISMIRD